MTVYFISNDTSSHGILLKYPRMVYLQYVSHGTIHTVYICAVSYSLLVYLYNICVMICLVMKDRTIDEAYNPQYYAYLFTPLSNIPDTFIVQTSNSSCLQRLCAFVRQAFNRHKID